MMCFLNIKHFLADHSNLSKGEKNLVTQEKYTSQHQKKPCQICLFFHHKLTPYLQPPTLLKKNSYIYKVNCFLFEFII